MTVLGVILTGAGPLLDLSPVVTMSGMLLVVAGLVKIGMVAIWQTAFRAPHGGNPENTRGLGSLPGGSAKPSEVWHEKLPKR